MHAQGKEPVLGSVDLLTYNNYSGVYTFGPDHTAKTADDELLAGEVWNGTHYSGSAGHACTLDYLSEQKSKNQLNACRFFHKS